MTTDVGAQIMKKQNLAVVEPQNENESSAPKAKLTVEALEARIAPALITDKKNPTRPPDAPYPPGTRYGLIRRDSLR